MNDRQKTKLLIIGIIVGLPFGIAYGVYKGLPMMLAVMVAVFAVIVVIISYFFEKRSEKIELKLKDSIESGEYFGSEEWQEKYRKYCEKHDFSTVKASSMEADLKRYFTRPMGYIMAAFSLLFFIPAIIWKSGDISANIFLSIGGLIFLVWGTVIIFRTPVRRFIRSCGDELPMIERSYLNGKMLVFRRNGIYTENNGINIGGNYIVIFHRKNILAIDRNSVTKAEKSVQRNKYYGDGLYTGSEMRYYLTVHYDTAKGDNCWVKIQLNEFQLEMAYEALSPYKADTSYDTPVRRESYF